MTDVEGVQVIARETVYTGYARVDHYRLRHRQFAGGWGPELSREVFERGQVGAVLPVDPVTDQVALIEQFRPGAYAAGFSPWLLECVAGVLEPGESYESLARREAGEEAGLRISELEFIAHYLSSPGACSEAVKLYCGCTDLRAAGGIHGLADEGEDIRVHRYTVDEAVALADSGRITNGKTLIALHWLARFYPQLKRRWVGDLERD